MNTLARTLRAGTCFALALLVASCGGADDAGTNGEGEAVSTPVVEGLSAEDMAVHMRALADDSMGGRSPGTPGGRMAAEYVAAAFESAGLEPVEGSYFQPVPLVGSTPLPESAALSIGGSDGLSDLAYLDDFVVWAGDAEATSSVAEGELVFVGYGIEAPENDWSDYGTDVTGKVVMILVNDPPAPEAEPQLFDGPAMTYYGRWTYKFEEAARQGAAAAFVIHSTEEAGYGWNVVRGSWAGEQFSLPADPSAATPVTVEGWVTRDVAAAAFEAAGHDLDELIQRAASRDFTPVETGVSVQTSVDSRVRTVDTRNVVGLLRGSERPDEVITVTSHYDHLGIGEAVEGDSIYNGAYDNASGTALLIELADAFTQSSDAPARSILFIATAAEEQGLLGAAWYVQNPLFPLSRTVAEVNVDGANLWGETDDVTVMGADRNELGSFVRPRADELGLSMVPDAEPEKGFFFRSDHFPFALAGVPAIYIEHGRAYRGRADGWGDSIQADYQATRYHAPGDEWDDAFDFDGAVQQGTLAYLVIRDIASSDGWPNWNEGSEFRAARDETMREAPQPGADAGDGDGPGGAD